MDFNIAARGGKKDGKDGKDDKADKAKPADDKPAYTKYPPTTYTSQEQEKLLIGYDKVPREGWVLIRPKTHLRYITTAGDFRRGGFVHNVKTRGKEMIFLENNLDARAPGYAKWPVTLEDVEEIWKKRTVEDVKMAAIEQNAGSPELENRVAALEVELEEASGEIKKLIQIIGRLNDRLVRLEPKKTVAASPRDQLRAEQTRGFKAAVSPARDAAQRR